jgi:hypothetical protein
VRLAFRRMRIFPPDAAGAPGPPPAAAADDAPIPLASRRKARFAS